MRISEAWRAVRQDPEWVKKAGLASLVGLIPYVGSFLTMGYALNYGRAAAQGTDGGRLPEWGALGDHARSALYVFAVSFVYALPLMLLVMPLSFVIAFGIAAAGETGVRAGFLALWLVFMAALVLLSFAYVPVTYAGLAAVVATGTPDAAFKVRDVWERARRNGGLLVVTSLRIIGAGLLAATPLLVGVPVFVAGIISAERSGNAAPVLLSMAIGAYVLSLMVVVALTGVVQLVAYRLLAEYARVAYEIPQPPAAAA